MARTAFGFEDDKFREKHCEKKSVSVCNTDSTSEVTDAVAAAKQRTQIVEEQFKELKKEHKMTKRLVRKDFKVTVGKAKEAIVAARNVSVAKVRESRTLKMKEIAARRQMEALLKERQSTRSASRNYNSYGQMLGEQSSRTTPNISAYFSRSNFQANHNLERNLQMDFQRIMAKTRKNSAKPRAAASFRSKSCGDITQHVRPGSGRRKSEQCKINWLTLELRNLKLAEHARNLSVAFSKKKSCELQLDLEFLREKKKIKTLVKQAKKAELQQEEIEAKKRNEMEKEMAEQEKEMEAKRKRREHNKMLLKNFQDSIFNTSNTRARIFSYFPLLVVCNPKKKSKISRTAHCVDKHNQIPCSSLQECQNYY